MKIFQLGVPKDSLTHLFVNGTTASTIEPDEPIDVLDALECEGSEVLLFNGTRYPWMYQSIAPFRRRGLEVPIIGVDSPQRFVNWPETRAEFLDAGGDDLLGLPVEPCELAATVRAVLRRYRRYCFDEREIHRGNSTIHVNFYRRTVSVNGQCLTFTPMELELLLLLAENVNAPCSKEAIFERLYGHDNQPEHNQVEVYMSRIRHKFTECGVSGEVIETVRCRGYLLRADE